MSGASATEYAAHVAKFAKLERDISVAIDAANGMAGHTLPSVLERVPRIRAHTLYMQPDGTFPNHEANPLLEENLVDLKKLVQAKKAELGVAFDGDADRCCFVDEQGVTARERHGLLRQGAFEVCHRDAIAGSSHGTDLNRGRSTSTPRATTPRATLSMLFLFAPWLVISAAL